MFSPPFFNEFLTVPRYGRTASLTMPSSLDDASLLPPLLPVFLTLVSWIILTTTTSLIVPEYQRGVQGNIIIFIPHHPVQRFFSSVCLFFSLSPSPSAALRFLCAFLTVSSGDARFKPGRWMAVLSVDLHPSVYLIIILFIFLNTPCPLL